MPDYKEAALAAGWIKGTFGETFKWWNPSNDDGSRYCDNERAFRYICEDHGIEAIKTEAENHSKKIAAHD
jgi:hypothetical protein